MKYNPLALALSLAPALGCRDILVRDSSRSLAGLNAEFAADLRSLVSDPDLQVQLKVAYALPLLQTSVLQLCLTRSPPALEEASSPAPGSGGGWLVERVGETTRLRHASAGGWSEGRVDEPAEEALVGRLVRLMRSKYETVEVSTAEKDLVGLAPARGR